MTFLAKPSKFHLKANRSLLQRLNNSESNGSNMNMVIIDCIKIVKQATTEHRNVASLNK